MKKKVFVWVGMISLCLSLAACSGNKAADITLDDITAAIQTVDSSFAWDEEKPYFEMIGASDGWMGYINETSPVKVYEFENEKAYKDVSETFGELMEGLPKNGNFVLECNDESVKEAFENIGK